MKTKIFITALLSSFLLLISCTKDEPVENLEISQEDAIASAKIDLAVDDISNVVLDEFGSEVGISAKTYATEKTTPNCATITRNPAFGTILTPGTQVTKTIDFGTTGCTFHNGNVLKGKIILSFVFQPLATSHTLTYRFDNFYHNGIKFNGTKTIIVSLSTSNANQNIHPIFVINLDINVMFPNNRVLKIVGTKTREIIQGQSTPEFSDNVYQITGNWETTFPNGATRTATITSPLIVKMTCPNIVKGIITFTKNGNSATLDFGDGNCDKQAMLTINGGTPVLIELK